jgi:hypothetical protein
MFSAIDQQGQAIDIRVNKIGEAISPIAQSELANLIARQTEIEELFARGAPSSQLASKIELYVAEVETLLVASNNGQELRAHLDFAYGALAQFQQYDASATSLQAFVSKQVTAGDISPAVGDLLNAALAAAQTSLESGDFEQAELDLANFRQIVFENQGAGVSVEAVEDLQGYAGFVQYVLAPMSLSSDQLLEFQAGAPVGTVVVPAALAGGAFTLTVSDDRFEVVDGSLQLKADQSVSLAAGATIPVIVVLRDAFDVETAQAFTLQVLANDFPWHNYERPEDVQGDGDIDIHDAILVIRQLRRAGSGPLATPKPAALLGGSYFDVDGNAQSNIHDAIAIIRYLRRNRAGGEGEAPASALSSPSGESDTRTPSPFTSATDIALLNWWDSKRHRSTGQRL